MSKYSNQGYDGPGRSWKNFFDRDWNEREKQGVLFSPSITVNGEVFRGDYKKANELFKLICSKIQSRFRPDECKTYGISNEKEKIMEEYEKQWG